MNHLFTEMKGEWGEELWWTVIETSIEVVVAKKRGP